MEVILLEKIQNLGELGDAVNVKNGYARNFLIPQKKAMRATKEAMAEVESKRKQLAEEEGKRIDGAKARAELVSREITLVRLCAEEGKLYGSVSPVDIAEALTVDNIVVEKSEVFQPEGPIKQTGDYEAEIILHPEVRFTVSIKVEGDVTESAVEEESEVATEEEAES